MVVQSARPYTANSPAQPNPVPLPNVPPDSSEPEDEVTFGSLVHSAAATVVGVAVGAVMSLSGAIVNGCAGGAEGVVHGAQLEGRTADLVLAGMTAANLAATGAIAGAATGIATQLALAPAEGVLAGAATNLVVGETIWIRQSDRLKRDVLDTADEWVDAVIDTSDPNASVGTRIWHGAVGEVVGMAAGAYVGATQGFQQGNEIGRRAVDRMVEMFSGSDEEKP